MKTIPAYETPPTTFTIRLFEFQQNADLEQFCSVFGPETGGHFWQRFNQLNQNLLTLYNTMDVYNRSILDDLLALEPSPF